MSISYAGMPVSLFPSPISLRLYTTYPTLYHPLPAALLYASFHFFSRIFPTNDTTHESCLYPIPNALHCHSHKASIRITLSYALT